MLDLAKKPIVRKRKKAKRKPAIQEIYHGNISWESHDECYEDVAFSLLLICIALCALLFFSLVSC